MGVLSRKAGRVRRQAKPVGISILWKPLRDSHYVVASLQPGGGGLRQIFARQSTLTELQALARANPEQAIAGVLLGKRLDCSLNLTPYVLIESHVAVGLTSLDERAIAHDIQSAVAQVSRRRKPVEVLGWFCTSRSPEAAVSPAHAAIHAACFRDPWQTILTFAKAGKGGAFFLHDARAARWFHAPFYEVTDTKAGSRAPRPTCIAWPAYLTTNTVVPLVSQPTAVPPREQPGALARPVARPVARAPRAPAGDTLGGVSRVAEAARRSALDLAKTLGGRAAKTSREATKKLDRIRAERAESAARRKAEADAARARLEEQKAREAAERRAAREEERRKAAELEKQRAAEAKVRRAAEEEARRKAAEETERRRAAEAEARRQAREAEAEAKRNAAEEAERQRAAEAEARRQAREAEARHRAEEAERQRAAEAEARRLAAEEAERQAAEDAQRKAEEDARRKAAREEARRKAVEEARRRAAEEEQRRVAAAEAEALREAEEAEARRLAEAEARQRAREAEARRKAEEAEALRIAEAVEARRKVEEEAEEERRKAAVAEVLRISMEVAAMREKLARAPAPVEGGKKALKAPTPHLPDLEDTTGADGPYRYLALARREGFEVTEKIERGTPEHPETIWLLHEAAFGLRLIVVTTDETVREANLHYNMRTDDGASNGTSPLEHGDGEPRTIYGREECLQGLRARCRRLRATGALERDWKVAPTSENSVSSSL